MSPIPRSKRLEGDACSKLFDTLFEIFETNGVSVMNKYHTLQLEKLVFPLKIGRPRRKRENIDEFLTYSHSEQENERKK